MFTLSPKTETAISIKQPLSALVDVKTKSPVVSRYDLSDEESLFSMVRNRLHRLQKTYALFDEAWLKEFDLLSSEDAWQVIESRILPKPFHLQKDGKTMRVNASTGYWTLGQIHPIAWEALQLIGWIHLGRRTSQGFGNIIVKPLL
jgi:hypothetical protein